MTEYQIQASTRRCALTDRELKPGERFYSVILDQGGKFLRQDYSAEAWQGPPPEAFSFWQGKLGADAKPRKQPIDDEMLTDCFARLENETDQGKVGFRYVLALLLLRRKRMRLDETKRQDGQEILHLRCLKTGTRYRVTDPQLNDDELNAVQDDVFQVLGWE